MKSLTLDQLLDNDALTPRQERQLRKFITYHLERGKYNRIEFCYKFLNSPGNKTKSHIMWEATLDELKSKSYRTLMFHMILRHSKELFEKASQWG